MTPRIHKLWPSWAVLIGLVVVFAGERVFAGQDTLRPLLAAVAAALLGAATVIRFQEWGAASQKKKGTAAILGASTAVIVVALVLYALIPLVFGGDDSASERMRAVLWAIWPIVLVTGALPLLFVESAVSPVAYIDRYESAQVSRSATRGVSLALFLSVLFVGNFLALRHDQKLELSAGHSATADEQTKRVVRDLTDKVKVVLFFPRANDVAERVAQYFEPLTALNDNLEVERIDHALAFELAKEAEVTENGYVALYRGKSHDKVQVGTKYKSARAALRRFDNNFVKALIRVTTDEKTAYYYAGHSERPFRRPPPDDKRGALTKLRRQLEAWQYKLKPFSIADGSATALPKDGEVLFIMGPEEPFLKEEIEVLQKAIKRGVRLFIALEGERTGDPMTGAARAVGTRVRQDAPFRHVVVRSADSHRRRSKLHLQHRVFVAPGRHHHDPQQRPRCDFLSDRLPEEERQDEAEGRQDADSLDGEPGRLRGRQQ